MILVFGAGGLLGSWVCAKYPKDVVGLTHRELDITDYLQVEQAILQHHPDAVINCAGIVKNNKDGDMELVNGEAPHQIAAICSEYGVRMVQVSSDCVFDGKTGWYRETDETSARDAYGRSKAIGEIRHPDHVTVRTSFVGWPDARARGLLHWLHNHLNVEGYANWIWNGLAVPVVADSLVGLAYNRRTGIVHLSGQVLSKYEVLRKAAKVLGWQRKITAVNHQEPVNRVLMRSGDIGFSVPGNFEQGLEQMKREKELLCQWMKSRL